MNIALTKRLRLLASAISVLALLTIIALAWMYSRVRASLPQLDGNSAIPGLVAAVTVDRDGLGVPTLHAGSRVDAARALGFVHAQDRFFQMDVWRRAAAGELAEIFGAKTLPHDRSMRMHGFRKLAQTTLARLPANQREILAAYAEGVNAGLAALGERPFEYLVIRAAAEPWKPEDSLLVCDAMLADLQDGTGRYEQTLSTLRDQLGDTALAFFAPLVTPDDAALDASTSPVPPIPGPKTLDVRAMSAAIAGPLLPRHAFAPADGAREYASGSNAFALSGAHTASGAAMVAGDMHLHLRVPNTWYRASLEYPGHKVTGVTLPGVPVIIAGSNGHVAWSFTNSYIDTGDLVAIDLNPISPTLYRVPGQTELVRLDQRHETIAVQGAKPVEVDYDWTIWGPIVAHDEKGRPLAFRWTGDDPDATNLGLMAMEDATDVATAVDVAHRCGMPAQNMVIADATGNTAWTIAGFVPRRIGYDGRLPVTFQYGDRKWDGYMPPDEIPVVTTRPTGRSAEAKSDTGRIWSANHRMLGGSALRILGDGGYARPNRAAQIRDDLAKLEHASPRDLLAVQLDNRALFLAPWNKLLLDTLGPRVTAQKEIRAALRRYAEKWEGRADVDALSYPITRLFRIAVYAKVFGPIFASCTQADPQFSWNQLRLEPAIWALLREKPLHLLESKYATWDDLLVSAVDDVIVDLDRSGVRLPYANWGYRNTAEIRHPFSYTLPWFFRGLLDMPRDPLPGDNDMPRVQAPDFGASERFVVSPGRENEGLFEMPCGQSGHPLSPYYRAGHEAWVKGEPTPFLPGPAEHKLTLAPSDAR